MWSAVPGTWGEYLHSPVTLTGTHVDRVATNANRSLGFIRRNIKTKSPKVRKMAYQTLVRSQLEYASAAWDPHIKDKNHKIEMTQRRVARWTTNDWDRETSVSSLLHQLDWQTLEQKRSVTRFCLFYKTVYGLVAAPRPHYKEPVVRPSRCNSMNFRQLHTSKDYYNIPSFHWSSSSGTPSLNMLLSLRFLCHSRTL